MRRTYVRHRNLWREHREPPAAPARLDNRTGAYMIQGIEAANSTEAAPIPSFLSSGVARNVTPESASGLCRPGGRETFMAKERWLSVPGFEGVYEVSDFGRVRSLDRDVVYVNGRTQRWRGQILKSSLTGNGYPAVELCRNGTGKTTSVHSIVAASFLGPRPPDKEVAHRDGNKENPKLSNLRYATCTENQADKIPHGKTAHGERNGLAKLTAGAVITIRERLNVGETGRAVAKDFGITPANVSQIKLRRTWPHI